jgi:SAM-dependent methyltransferase
MSSWLRERFDSLDLPLRDRSAYMQPFARKRGIEIGGPSRLFGEARFLELYQQVAALDGCNWSTQTVWEGALRDGQPYTFLAGREPGRQFVSDGTVLASIADATYDFVISSNCLEHIANPLKALREWRRVLAPGGALLLVLPRRSATFDHRRPVTPLQHMIEDFENDVAEDDLTHLPEILELHDLRRDPRAGDRQAFHKRSLDNVNNRCLHHHVFDLTTAQGIVKRAGFRVLRAQAARPGQLVVLAQRE